MGNENIKKNNKSKFKKIKNNTFNSLIEVETFLKDIKKSNNIFQVYKFIKNKK